jgi:N-acetyl-anhydromuramyl-L-alanine amidase AmpD
MLVVSGGVVRDMRIDVKIYPRLEHGLMKDVSGIVLHQTSSDYVVKTMAEYAFRPSGAGAHFLINPAGQIFQTARINQVCWHVGRLNPLCQEIHRCTPTDAQVLMRILKEVGHDKEEYDRQVDAWEQKKPSAYRYPANGDSIGIEVVGAMKNGAYPRPSNAQNQSSRWLVSALISTLNLDRGRIFPHGLIDPRKEKSEGGLVAY